MRNGNVRRLCISYHKLSLLSLLICVVNSFPLLRCLAIPSIQRTPPPIHPSMAIDIAELEAIDDVKALPGGFPDPATCTPFKEDEVQDVARSLVPAITKILQDADVAELQKLYYREGFWRDQVSLAWTFRTFHSIDSIVKNVPPLIRRASISDVALIPEEVQAIDLPNGVSLLRIGFSFRTSNPSATCHAAFKFMRLSNGDLKIFTTTTSLKDLDAAPWKDCKRTKEVSKDLPNETEALVVGAGHAGLALAAFLQALDIDFAIVDREEQVGDAWDKRYDSATLHTSRVFSGLPYRPFPKDYPEYINAKQLAQYYKLYAKDLNLPIYQSTNVEKAQWDEASKKWTVQTSRGTIVTRSLIFAIGIGGRYPVRPDYPNEESFKGQVLHSVSYTNPEKWIGKKVAVIGAATTGLDVAWDCSQLGIKTTVVQRGATRIYAPGHITQVQKRFWNDTTGAEFGDTVATEDPVVLNACLSNLVMKMQKEAHDQSYYEGLAKAGFLAQNEGAVHNQIFCRVGRHYPDIGAGEAIIRGDFAIKSGAAVTGFTPDGLAFDDGTHLDADIVCFCTGFKKDNRSVIADIIGDEIKLEPVWNLDKEGEIRGVFRPTGHDGVWVQGGELQTMRYYGRFLALQVAAVLKGVRPQPVRL